VIKVVATFSPDDVLVVIPARWASSRFPGKPLVRLCGKSMIEHVYLRAKASAVVGGVVVATDDERIRAECERFGADVVLTRGDHATGTDRVAEAVSLWQARCGRSPAVVVNVQGDEPLLPPENVRRVVELMRKHSGVEMGTLACTCTEEEFVNPNVVKVVCRADGRALYFSRAAIPLQREAVYAQAGTAAARKHIGIYAYRTDFLRRFVELPQTLLELCEKLEQLRALEHGHEIVVGNGLESFGVDTPEQALEAERLLAGARV
jgi:3-deoxy-manno-octulosonate cytidylyltransferase (CMP-KDO synthetase)